jgi:alkylated DNA repair dioxygenase AlkB
MAQDQLSLLPAVPNLPQGFKYSPEVISPDEEQGLLERIRQLPLAEFQFHGFTGKRRVISYGWKYDFEERAVREAESIPSWLLPLRERAAGFASVEPDQLQQALVTEYDVGAAIGWHRDKAVFGDVIGISLLSSCRFRLRRKVGTKWERASLMADARSAYLLRGASRMEWEHSIPAVDTLRYSITFRSFQGRRPHFRTTRAASSTRSQPGA